jgi:hypothetical protein
MQLYQVQCRDQIDGLFYTAFCLFPLRLSYLMADTELWKLEIFWEINLDQNVGIHKNNLGWK